MQSNPEQQSGESQNSEELQSQYRNLVEKSSVLNEKEKQVMLDSLQTAEGKNPDTIKMMLGHFPEAEKSADKINKEYNTQIAKEIAEGRFAKKSAEAYEKWFKELSFKEKAEVIKAKSTDLHDPKRQKLLDAFNGKTEFGSVFIPAAVRDEFREKFFNGDLEEREALLKLIAAQHKKLKERFTALPKEVQEKYREKFKGLGLADREKLLRSIAEKKGEKSTEQKGAEKIESERLYNDFCAETKKMVEDNTLAPKSKIQYDEWFKALPLAQKRSMATRSEIHSKMKERIKTRDDFYTAIKKSPDMRAKYELKFRNADLDERKKILGTIQQNESQTPQKTSWLKNFIRRLTFSSGHGDIKEKIETFAITNEIAERRHRFRLAHHTREESAQKAEDRGMDETAKDSRKLAQATELSSLKDAEGGMKVKLDTLEHHAEARHKWKRMLKPNIDDKDAKLSADITLRTKAGDEVIDERAFQRGELQRELDSVKKAVAPVIDLEAHHAGINVTQKQIEEELKKADWERHGKETIKKAA